ncbi:conserved hypothetical protein [uncultured delta proteobacterium]|uniref:Zinc finger/thioredoxin putative domain-containing protein n=1 Tax=uncultured delta proteobacterium TaxID=34034 RepID=A0A212J581_9DELT|nr:conserved hypothetical protein [uncultured delta proteobacterium]
MIVTCPQCETKFDIPDDKYRPGRKARCSNCGNVFALPELDDAVSPEGAAAPAGMAAATPPRAEEAASFDAADEAFADIADEELADDAPEGDIAAPPASVDDVVSPLAKKAAGNKISKKKLILLGGMCLVVALLAYGGIMVYSAVFAPPKGTDPVRATDGSTVESLGGKTRSADQEKEAARLAAVRRLSLENVRQYTVTENEKTGPMVVVEGAVVNNFETPKDLILLEITLYDAKGNALVMREQYCGVTLSLLQLRTLPQAAIEGALVNQSVILSNNTDILPGSSVRFTSVFFDLPHSAYEFEVKIIDVQDPAKK